MHSCGGPKDRQTYVNIRDSASVDYYILEDLLGLQSMFMSCVVASSKYAPYNYAILLIWGKYRWSYSKWPAVITHLLHHQTAYFMNIHNCCYIAGLPSMLAQQKQLQVRVYAV